MSPACIKGQHTMTSTSIAWRLNEAPSFPAPLPPNCARAQCRGNGGLEPALTDEDPPKDEMSGRCDPAAQDPRPGQVVPPIIQEGAHNTAKVEKTITINAPVEKVLAYVEEPSNVPEYWPSVIEVKDVDPLPNGGARYGWLYKMAACDLRAAAKRPSSSPTSARSQRTRAA
ncbi:SRPBCC family protein [Chloroflexota bacterium]